MEELQGNMFLISTRTCSREKVDATVSVYPTDTNTLSATLNENFNNVKLASENVFFVVNLH